MRSPRGILLAAVATTACASVYPEAMIGRTTFAPAAAFDCAERAVVRLGYVIQEANRETGFLRAQSAAPQGMTLGGVPVFGQLTIAVLRDSVTRLSVTATDADEARILLRSCR